ncbi:MULTISPECIES: hypothetical protein [Vibrio]|uniref:hypothetical protein n=1 Tax=Vibrio TaxID=662 RepID=UPI00078DB611|nr:MULTISPECIES: hypothetical protein [Vibrio]BAU70789.1 hypothetical protein [Vibrio sp. 04Ya108]BBM67643.1 hypothetical protein VA249_42890 [Vibrio alfacsensis]BCN27125.1 hypothetical protein VYA_43170 [Vibrio alfacsensis]
MARLVPTVIGSRKDVFEHLSELGMLDDVKRLSEALNSQFKGVRVEQTLEDGNLKVTEYEIVATTWEK